MMDVRGNNSLGIRTIAIGIRGPMIQYSDEVIKKTKEKYLTVRTWLPQ